VLLWQNEGRFLELWWWQGGGEEGKCSWIVIEIAANEPGPPLL
jgi:hypothetical protein